ncbi:MAG: hypothetical protein JJ863_30815 [Deltaproteobacteria bacterium]|nr:hypothetical protein [Deltaproteobacteria bacterium]
MSAAPEIDPRDAGSNDADPDERPSGIRRTSRVRVAAHQGRASSPEIGEAPVDNGVRGLRLIIGFWTLVVVAVVAWLLLR